MNDEQGKKDSRVDAYIKKSNDFAKPILIFLRELVHQGCPNINETIKWGVPHFEYKGSLCFMAAFTGHCSFGFRKAPLIKGLNPEKNQCQDGLGNLGKIKSMSDLPHSNLLLSYIQEATKLNDDNIKLIIPKKDKKEEPLIAPVEFIKDLEKNGRSKEIYENFSPSKKKDYIEWICEAKTEATKISRISTALKWIGEGKSRNWKYERSKNKK